MSEQLFFLEVIPAVGHETILPAETSKYLITVLRMHEGDKISFTDGKGIYASGELISVTKKTSSIRIDSSSLTERPRKKISLGISVLKNASRFEWMLEKVTEIGVTSIVPLICERTERQHFRTERMKSIITSAMSQSQQTWLPDISLPIPFQSAVNTIESNNKCIAHCLPGEKKRLTTTVADDNLILIGPEGDFTLTEIEYAIAHEFKAVTLGDTRLRTETAGIVAVTLLAVSNKF